jgi:hypothetical protein
MKRLLAVIGFVLAATTTAFAQKTVDLASEVSVTGGASTDQVSAGAMQSRVFGDVQGTRVFGELSWATVAGPVSDAFGGAYPYERRVQVMEAYGERMMRVGPAIAGVRAGRFRTPFGIYSSADHGYAGFLRAPLIRYVGYWALSNTFLEHGVNVMGGVPWLQAEYTVAAPGDAGTTRRRDGLDQVVRLQGYYKSLTVGASHIDTLPYQTNSRALASRAMFNGFDARWMQGGFQLRGEWLDGRPFDGMHTRGGYIDAFVHRREMGPVTALARAEVLDYDAGERSRLAKRVTVGARIHVVDALYAQVNGSHQIGALYSDFRNSADLALTYTVRFPR